MSQVALVSVSSYAVRLSLTAGHFKHAFKTSFILAVLLDSRISPFCITSTGCLSKVWKAMMHCTTMVQSALLSSGRWMKSSGY